MESPSLLYHMIVNHGDTTPEAPAILAPGKQALSYGRLAQHLRSTALHLARLGLCPGDRVAVVLPNGPEMATAFFAVSAACTCAPLNPSYQLDEFKFSFEDFRVKALIALPDAEQAARRAARQMGIPVITLQLDADAAGVFNLESDLPVDESLSAPLLAGMEEVAVVLHTSGTTSRPKIVPLTQINLFYSSTTIAATYALTPADRCMNVMPLFHVHGLFGAVSSSLVAGGSVLCTPGFDPGQLLAWFTEFQPTWYTAVPTIHQAVLEQIRRQPEIAEHARLRFIRSSSSSLAPQVAQDLEKVFNCPALEAYGMTEGTHQITSNPLPPHPRKYGSVGLMNANTRVVILDEEGRQLPANAIGEISMRGGNVMQGYENNPSANASGFTDGWLRTGDRGYLDDDGYLFIDGRFKELINRGGEKISPREIDEVLLRHPAVEQAVAFAVPHPSLGEDVAAAVVLRQGQQVTAQDLRQHVAASLADFKIPRQVVFVKAIPKGSTNKIQRIGLADKLKTELDSLQMHAPDESVEPSSSLEAEVLAIWQDVLGHKAFGVQDDFLALGGDSIQAARILAQVNERLGAVLQIEDIFNAPSIVSLSALIRAEKER